MLFGQICNPDTICSTDTMSVEPNLLIKPYPQRLDTNYQIPCKAVFCRTRSMIGFRVEFALSNYYYGEKTSSWIGQHGGPNFNFSFAVKKFNLGFRFKPWTIDPQKEMNFNGNVLPTTAIVNVIKLDYYLGYSLDFKRLISVEPYVGYNRSSFPVINQDELNQEFVFNKTGGFVMGATFNKYFSPYKHFMLKDYEYLSLFVTVGYGFVNFEKVHPDLDNGYFEWNFGFSYKGFATNHFAKKVE